MIPTLVLTSLLALPAPQQLQGGGRAQGAAPVAVAGDTFVRYDVSELVGADRIDGLLRDLTSGQLSEDSALAVLDRYVSVREEVETQTGNLLGAIRDLIRPGFDEERNRIEMVDWGTLAVFGSGAQHEWVRSFLEATAEFDGLIAIDSWVIMVPHGGLEDLVGSRTGRLLQDGEADRILEAAREGKSCDLVTAPKLTVYPYSAANLSVINQIAYVKDFELTVVPELDQELADPVIDVLQTGIVLDVVGVPIANGGLALHCKLTYSSADRPFPTSTVRVGAAGHPVTIQLPEVTTLRADGRFDLMPGQSMLMATVDPGAEDGDEEARDVIVVLRAQRIDLDGVQEHLDGPEFPVQGEGPRKR